MTIGERYSGIIDAACEVFARRGYHVATIREIARAARLSLAGLYHYVGGKDELLFLVLDRGLTTLLRNLDETLAAARTPEARLLALIQTHLEFGFTHTAANPCSSASEQSWSMPARVASALSNVWSMNSAMRAFSRTYRTPGKPLAVGARSSSFSVPRSLFPAPRARFPTRSARDS